MCCNLESILFCKEVFLEQDLFHDSDKFPARFLPLLLINGSSEDKKVYVNEHDWIALWLVDWLLRIRAWQIFRENYFYK